MHGSQFAELQIIDGEEVACFVSARGVQADAGAAVGFGAEHRLERRGSSRVYLRGRQEVLRHRTRLWARAEPGGDDVSIAVGRGCLEREFVNVLCVEEEGRRNEPVVAVEHRLFGIGVGHVALFVKPSIVVAVGIFDGERHQTARCVERFLIGQGHFLAEHDFLRRGGFALYVAPITFHIVGVNAEARNLCRLGAGGGVALVDGCAVGLAHHFIGNGRTVHVTAVRALRRAPCHRDTIVSAERGGGVDSLGRVVPYPYAQHVHGAAAGGVAGIYFNNVCAFGHRGRHADATACGCGALGNDVAVNAHAVSEGSRKGIAAKGLAGQREAHGAARRALGKVGGNAADAPGSAGGGEGRGGVKTHKLHVLVYCGEFLGCARCEVHFAYLNVLLRAVRRHHPEEAARGIVERGGLVVFDVLARGTDERQRGVFLVHAHEVGIFADAVEFAFLIAGKGEEFLGEVADGRHLAGEHVECAEVIAAPDLVVTQSEAAEHLVGHGVVSEVGGDARSVFEGRFADEFPIVAGVVGTQRNGDRVRICFITDDIIYAVDIHAAAVGFELGRDVYGLRCRAVVGGNRIYAIRRLLHVAPAVGKNHAAVKCGIVGGLRDAAPCACEAAKQETGDFE